MESQEIDKDKYVTKYQLLYGKLARLVRLNNNKNKKKNTSDATLP